MYLGISLLSFQFLDPPPPKTCIYFHLMLRLRLQMERNIYLPELSYSQYSIESIDRLRSLNVSQEQQLHYYLECFHQYYNAEFILRVVILL